MTTTTDATSNAYLDGLRTAAKASATAGTKGSQTIDQAGFLKLLTAQMSNQDPTQPLDSNTMVQQLSQMTQTSGITEMNAALKSLLAEYQGNRVGDAAAWIGKAALLNSTTAQALPSGGFAGQVTLPSDARTLGISLQDQSGATVWSETLTDRKAGAVDFAFDGKKADGTAVSGPLKVVVSAVGDKGTIQPTVATWATVTGVNSPAGGSAAQITTANGTVSPADVLSLS